MLLVDVCLQSLHSHVLKLDAAGVKVGEYLADCQRFIALKRDFIHLTLCDRQPMPNIVRETDVAFQALRLALILLKGFLQKFHCLALITLHREAGGNPLPLAGITFIVIQYDIEFSIFISQTTCHNKLLSDSTDLVCCYGLQTECLAEST